VLYAIKNEAVSGCAAYRIALKWRATCPPAQTRWTKSVPRQGTTLRFL